MPPQYQKTLGSFDENQLTHLDNFMDMARKNTLYIIFPFTHGLALATQNDSAFSNPGGVEGLIHQPKLRAGFKNYMAKVITQINTVNGIKYSEDPTILSWMIIEEIVSFQFNYPNGFPKVTPLEITDWLQENADYIKSIDTNHLISINTTSAIDQFDSLNQDWRPIIRVSGLDFIEVEDAEARILNRPDQMYTIDSIYTLGKPIVMMLSYTGGEVDRNMYCHDYKWQADTLRKVADLYLDKGADGFTIFSWRPSQISGEECYSYSIDNVEIVTVLKYISEKLGTQNIPPNPLDFVRLIQK
jgi:hypothetical protein